MLFVPMFFFCWRATRLLTVPLSKQTNMSQQKQKLRLRMYAVCIIIVLREDTAEQQQQQQKMPPEYINIFHTYSSVILSLAFATQ